MSKNCAILLAVALATVSCSHGLSRIRTHSLPRTNPTVWTFPLPVKEVYAEALQVYSIEHQVKKPIFERSASPITLELALSAECATNAVYGRSVFADPANAYDIYLHSSHTPFVISSVYRGRDGGLPFIANFHLHLAGSGSDTVVTVTASDAEVINGTRFGIGSCGPGQKWNCVKVKPTTIEEYSILAYLGRYLGITNMPPVILPAQ